MLRNNADAHISSFGYLWEGLALGRETLGTSLLEECLELSQQPAEDPESKRGCDFCHKQEDIQKLSPLDQQTCICKGKFDTTRAAC